MFGAAFQSWMMKVLHNSPSSASGICVNIFCVFFFLFWNLAIPPPAWRVLATDSSLLLEHCLLDAMTKRLCFWRSCRCPLPSSVSCLWRCLTSDLLIFIGLIYLKSPWQTEQRRITWDARLVILTKSSWRRSTFGPFVNNSSGNFILRLQGFQLNVLQRLVHLSNSEQFFFTYYFSGQNFHRKANMTMINISVVRFLHWSSQQSTTVLTSEVLRSNVCKCYDGRY